jgi:hypothetical protein
MNMNFDKHIQAILESLSTIPAFDGKREVYGYSSALSDGKLFYRFDEDDLEHWDKWENVYWIDGEPMDNFGTEFTDRDEFFKVVEDVAEKYSTKYSDMHDIPLAVEQMKENIPTNIPGVYRYFGNHDHGDFWWGVELDVESIRRNQINTDLKDVDTSGFEDLM